MDGEEPVKGKGFGGNVGALVSSRNEGACFMQLSFELSNLVRTMISLVADC